MGLGHTAENYDNKDLGNCMDYTNNPNANKLQIKSEVEELYGVQVLSVNTMNYSGKSKSRFTNHPTSHPSNLPLVQYDVKNLITLIKEIGHDNVVY